MTHTKSTSRATASRQNGSSKGQLSWLAVSVLAACLAAVSVHSASLSDEGASNDQHSRKRRSASWRRVGGSDGYGACSLNGVTPLAWFAVTEPFPQNSVNLCKEQCAGLASCGAFTIYQATGASPVCYLHGWSQTSHGDMTTVEDQGGVWRRCFYDANAEADSQAPRATTAGTTTVPACARSENNANLLNRPHVVYMLADDMGVGDLGVQGHP